MNFENSMKVLEEMAEKIRSEKTTLDEALTCYEKGMKAYNQCQEILKDARQKIEVYSEEK